jgi:hypothetical protein
LTAVESRLQDRAIPHALIGGLALGVHKVIRATVDLDYLVDSTRESEVYAFMTDLGFSSLRRTEELSNYSLAHVHVDFVHAHREYSRAMLQRAPTVEFLSLRLPVATVEDVIASLGFFMEMLCFDNHVEG